MIKDFFDTHNPHAGCNPLSESGTQREGFVYDDEDFELPKFIRTQQRESEKEHIEELAKKGYRVWLCDYDDDSDDVPKEYREAIRSFPSRPCGGVFPKTPKYEDRPEYHWTIEQALENKRRREAVATVMGCNSWEVTRNEDELQRLEQELGI